MVVTTQTIEQQQQELNAELTALRQRQLDIDDALAADWKNDALHAESAVIASKISSGERALGALSDRAVEVEREEILLKIERLQQEHVSACQEAEKLGKSRDQLKADLQRAETDVRRAWDHASSKTASIRNLERRLNQLQ